MNKYRSAELIDGVCYRVDLHKHRNILIYLLGRRIREDIRDLCPRHLKWLPLVPNFRKLFKGIGDADQDLLRKGFADDTKTKTMNGVSRCINGFSQELDFSRNIWTDLNKVASLILNFCIVGRIKA